MKKRKNSTISKSFITSTSIIFSVFIVAVALSFNVLMKQNSTVLKNALTGFNQDILLGKVTNIIDRLYNTDAQDLKSIKKEIINYCTGEREFLYVVIYTRTEDDNFFKIAEKITINNNLKLDIDKKEIVREKKEENYLKQGLLHGTVEPQQYSQDSWSWQNVYYPYEGKKKYVIQFLVSTIKTEEVITQFNESLKKIRYILFGISAALIILVFILSLLFSHNFSLLIRNLSLYMNRAAEGELDVNLKTTGDAELNRLAASFNSLIEELKDKSDKGDADPYSDIFKTGVSMLKENMLDDAIAIFRTLAILRPKGFGNYFNLGVAHAKKRDFTVALNMFNRAMEINPANELTARYIEKVNRLMGTDDQPG